MEKFTVRIHEDSDARMLRFWADQRGYNVSEYIAIAVKEKVEREGKRLESHRLRNLMSDLGEVQAKTAAWWIDLFIKYGIIP